MDLYHGAGGVIFLIVIVVGVIAFFVCRRLGI